MSSRSVVLFDLDGTVSDSAPGILAALRHAFVVNDLEPLPEAAERALLGPPFYESLPPLIGGTDRLPDVLGAYRERYETTMYDTVVYPGVRELLDLLRARGVRMAVATSKPEPFAVPIVEHLGLAEHFETVGGDELDGSLPTKALVIEKVLRRLANPPAARVVMVGDRSHDVFGAREHGIDCLGVQWGYGLPGELESAAPAAICATPDEIARWLDVEAG